MPLDEASAFGTPQSGELREPVGCVDQWAVGIRGPVNGADLRRAQGIAFALAFFRIFRFYESDACSYVDFSHYHRNFLDRWRDYP